MRPSEQLALFWLEKSQESRCSLKVNLVQDKWIGRLYDELFNARQQGDYVPMLVFDAKVAAAQAHDVVAALPELRKAVTELVYGKDD